MKDKKILNAILKTDLSSFVHKVFNTINPGQEFEQNWHIDLIAEYLNEVEKGNIKRLIINMPPRALKSVSVSVAWPAFLLGRNPKTRLMVASYSQILSTKLSLDTRFILESPWYKKLFSKTRIHPKQNQKKKFMTTQFGFRFATSVGGTATGEGGDILIVDDPHNPSHMASEKMRDKTINWFTETFSTRLNNRNEGKIVVVMQRLHENDLSGFLIKEREDEWHLLKIPVLAKEKTHFAVGNFKHKMEKGESLNEKLFSKENITKLSREIGESNFQAQYMQSPNVLSSGILKEEYLKFYKTLPSSFERIIQSWDTAIKTNETSDYSACTTWGISDGNYYLISMLEEKFEYPELKKAAKKLAEEYKPFKIIIEDKASGQSLIQDLKNEGFKNIVPSKAITDKITRFATCLDLFECGRVLLPAQGYIHHKVTKQLVNFPAVKHDDIVDSITQFLNHMKKNRGVSEIKIRSI